MTFIKSIRSKRGRVNHGNMLQFYGDASNDKSIIIGTDGRYDFGSSDFWISFYALDYDLSSGFAFQLYQNSCSILLKRNSEVDNWQFNVTTVEGSNGQSTMTNISLYALRHIVIRRVEDKVQLFFNTQMVVENIIPPTDTLNFNDTILPIGNRYNRTEAFNGCINNFIVGIGTITDDQIKLIHSLGGVVPSSLHSHVLNHWPLTESVYRSIGNIKKYSGNQTSFDSGAFSGEFIPANEDGYLEFSLEDSSLFTTAYQSAIGLSSIDVDNRFETIEFGIRINCSLNNLSATNIIESGKADVNYSSLSGKEKFKIHRNGSTGQVNLYIDEILVHTYIGSSTAALYVDASFRTYGAIVGTGFVNIRVNDQVVKNWSYLPATDVSGNNIFPVRDVVEQYNYSNTDTQILLGSREDRDGDGGFVGDHAISSNALTISLPDATVGTKVSKKYFQRGQRFVAVFFNDAGGGAGVDTSLYIKRTADDSVLDSISVTTDNTTYTIQTGKYHFGFYVEVNANKAASGTGNRLVQWSVLTSCIENYPLHGVLINYLETEVGSDPMNSAPTAICSTFEKGWADSMALSVSKSPHQYVELGNSVTNLLNGKTNFLIYGEVYFQHGVNGSDAGFIFDTGFRNNNGFAIRVAGYDSSRYSIAVDVNNTLDVSGVYVSDIILNGTKRVRFIVEYTQGSPIEVTINGKTSSRFEKSLNNLYAGNFNIPLNSTSLARINSSVGTPANGGKYRIAELVALENPTLTSQNKSDWTRSGATSTVIENESSLFHYRVEEREGLILHDSVHSNDGLLKGYTHGVFVEKYSGLAELTNALFLDGSDEYILDENPAISYEQGATYTIMLVFKMSNDTFQDAYADQFVYYRSLDNNHRFRIQGENLGRKLQVVFGIQTVSLPYDINLEQLNILFITFNSNNQISLYSSTGTRLAFVNSPNVVIPRFDLMQETYFGRNALDASGPRFSGTMIKYAIWSKSLSTKEMTMEANNTILRTNTISDSLEDLVVFNKDFFYEDGSNVLLANPLRGGNMKVISFDGVSSSDQLNDLKQNHLLDIQTIR